MKGTSPSCWASSRIARATLFSLLLLPWLRAQDNQPLRVAPLGKLRVARGERAEFPLRIELKAGYHVKSHLPGEATFVPLRLTWEKRPFRVVEVRYPKPSLRRYAFSDRPLSVLSGAFEIATVLEAPRDAPRGPGVLLGWLRFQACTAALCLPPRTLEVRLPYEIR
ncbi:MAG: protein-disulfide reductase DsbD family protein [Bryobacterales bacterium]|nr:protein-disulfide reductase DsbD family protein [Bryobacteraceae bacterium]MDW8131746.1 protein-disulfide reductase DsbD family protein [Bryobacterales bacterium]